jgi:hypothetical protein
MNCDEAKNVITIGVFGEPDPAETSALEEHLRHCPACARAWEQAAALRNPGGVPEDLPKPDWNRSWDVIARRSLDTPKTLRIFGLPGSWVFASAALLAVFVLGFFVGRRYLKPGPEPAYARVSLPAEATPFQAYADSVEPILTDFLNRGKTDLPAKTVELRNRILRSMVEETRLFKGLAEQAGDAELGNLLDELENTLVSLSNLKPGDRASADRLDRTIRERGVRSKLRELSGVKISL